MPAHLTFKERDEFKLRLNSSLKNAGLKSNSPTQLRAAFLSMDKESNISLAAVYRWLDGESLPDSQNMNILAQVCNVCPYWLRTGLLKSEDYQQPD